MERIEKSIEVEKPLRTVYDQWTQFEDFPRFMEGVEEVHQIDDRTLHWIAKVAGKREEWEAQIIQQVPDQQIAWRHTAGAINSGVVTFTPLAGDRCRVTLAMEHLPEGFVEKVGDALGFVSRRVEGDLQRFKKFIEERGAENRRLARRAAPRPGSARRGVSPTSARGGPRPRPAARRRPPRRRRARAARPRRCRPPA
ncbi:MAG: SRPBCC family protein [Anaeromyxobacter sp.]